MSDRRTEMVREIVNYEARWDSNGKIKVYYLSPIDGGGVYEVAGINTKYHPKAAKRLRDLVEAGRPDDALAEAVEYIAKYTDRSADQSDIDAVKFLWRDIAWNRGPTGAVRTFRLSLGLSYGDKMDAQAEKTLRQAEGDVSALIDAIVAGREKYERHRERGPGHPMWPGLNNRWRKAANFARGLK